MNYLCYFLTNNTNNRFTYVGITNNFARRLRQHNGEIKGGARYTRRYRPWRPFIQVTGFRSKREVLQFEWAMKHKRKGKRGGKQGRIKTLEYLLSVERWCKKAPRTCELNLTVFVWMTREEYLKLGGLSDLRKRDWVLFNFNM